MDDARLLVKSVAKCRREGMTCTAIAEALKVDERFVYEIARRVGKVKRGRRPGHTAEITELAKRVADLYQDGQRAADIAVQIGRSPARVWGLLHIAGVKVRKQKRRSRA